VNTILQNINFFDGLYIHIKGPDESGHDGDYNEKKGKIEEIDKYFFRSLLNKIDLKNVIIAVTGDHSTPCVLGAHSCDPVPLLIAGADIHPDGSLSFSEKAAKLGSLGEVIGKDLLEKLVGFAKN